MKLGKYRTNLFRMYLEILNEAKNKIFKEFSNLENKEEYLKYLNIYIINKYAEKYQITEHKIYKNEKEINLDIPKNIPYRNQIKEGIEFAKTISDDEETLESIVSIIFFKKSIINYLKETVSKETNLNQLIIDAIWKRVKSFSFY